MQPANPKPDRRLAKSPPTFSGEDRCRRAEHFNDRLLLGLKGAMRDAKLHLLRAGQQGGILNPARRGECVGFGGTAVGDEARTPAVVNLNACIYFIFQL